MKNKQPKFKTGGTVQNSNRKIVERGRVNTSNTYTIAHFQGLMQFFFQSGGV
jgi:hypothetical protein